MAGAESGLLIERSSGFETERLPRAAPRGRSLAAAAVLALIIAALVLISPHARRSVATAFPGGAIGESERDDCEDAFCEWTLQYNCPGQPAGSVKPADDDGSVNYDCCCKRGRWASLNSKSTEGVPDLEGPPLYVFGYGSLLFRFSSFQTDCEVSSVTAQELESMSSWAKLDKKARDCIDADQRKAVVLVKAVGVRRGWYAPGRLGYEELNGTVYTAGSMADQALDISPTYLGAVVDPAAECYGLVYPVTESELKLTDKRETSADYSPGFLGAEDLEVLGGSPPLPADAKVRWYPMSEESVMTPSSVHPIVQSYVDLFVGGALELEDSNNVSDYAMSVIASTYDWSKHWINDRTTPYRPLAKDPLAAKITAALQRASLAENSTLDASHLMAISFR